MLFLGLDLLRSSRSESESERQNEAGGDEEEEKIGGGGKKERKKGEKARTLEFCQEDFFHFSKRFKILLLMNVSIVEKSKDRNFLAQVKILQPRKPFQFVQLHSHT
jgi:hypothetical protein